MTALLSSRSRFVPILWTVLIAALLVVACSRDDVLGSDDDSAAEASPSTATSTATEPQPMTIVTPTPVTPGATVPVPPTPVSGQNPETYVVGEGDTLYGIALKFGVELDDLIALNGLSDPNDIRVGQALKIPPKQ